MALDNMNSVNSNMTDEKLAMLAQSGNMDAEEILMRKYKDVVKVKARLYYMPGADEDDVVQEGMIGLFKAVHQYNPDRSASFGTFAGVCVTRQIINAIRTADRKKYQPLNDSVSLSNPVSCENDTITLADTLSDDSVLDPESIYVLKNVIYYFVHNGDDLFSEFELRVLNELFKGNDYDYIAAKLDRSTKSIDNAVRRIKKKIADYLMA